MKPGLGSLRDDVAVANLLLPTRRSPGLCDAADLLLLDTEGRIVAGDGERRGRSRYSPGREKALVCRITPVSRGRAQL